MDLFEAGSDRNISPLADAMRPESLDEFVGQEHIVGKGRLLRRAIQADQLSSVIFYGPPGTGKTTLARIIAKPTKSSFITINAVLAGVKEIRDAIEQAKKKREFYGTRTILFVDEVHRWNKAQQDALLPWVENGTFIFIGATTENPYFEVNSALVSRSRVFQLLPLSNADLMKAAEYAVHNVEKGYGRYRIEFEEGALEHIVAIANGDARSMLNALQLAVETTPDVFPPPDGTVIRITLEIAEESIQKKAVLYDKEGDYHYDTISAFIKSLRGSDPDAALYWMARMVEGGEDPKFIFRRMMILASEDVGLADPYALGVVVSAAQAFDRVGMPEGQFFMSHAALYLASAKKSNSSLAYFDALEAVKKEKQAEVPSHLKDASRDKESFGHGEGYKYPHAFRDHWVAQQYLPDNLRGKVFYIPGHIGYEAESAKLLSQRREAQIEAQFDTAESFGEVYSFSKTDRAKDAWLRRTISQKNVVLSEIRDMVFADLNIQRHHKVLIPGNDRGLLTWEAVRKTPEGGVFVLVDSVQDEYFFKDYPSLLSDIEKPSPMNISLTAYSESRDHLQFDIIAGRNFMTRDDKQAGFRALYELLEEDGCCSVAQIIPVLSSRLSDFILKYLDADDRNRFLECEKKLFNDSDNQLFNWNHETLAENARMTGFEVHCIMKEFMENRLVMDKDLQNWFNSDNPYSYGAVLTAESEQLKNRVRNVAANVMENQTITWKSVYAFLRLRRSHQIS
ncbi:MAG: AAA family ATPase [Spirochaetia bacterium]|nr:AAA family ATPase [Spirochaetia bacterium]